MSPKDKLFMYKHPTVKLMRLLCHPGLAPDRHLPSSLLRTRNPPPHHRHHFRRNNNNNNPKQRRIIQQWHLHRRRRRRPIKVMMDSPLDSTIQIIVHRLPRHKPRRTFPMTIMHSIQPHKPLRWDTNRKSQWNKL